MHPFSLFNTNSKQRLYQTAPTPAFPPIFPRPTLFDVQAGRIPIQFEHRPDWTPQGPSLVRCTGRMFAVLIWRASCVVEEERKERGEAEAAASAMLADDLGRYKRCTTEEGKTYYIDRHSKTTSWTLSEAITTSLDLSLPPFLPRSPPSSTLPPYFLSKRRLPPSINGTKHPHHTRPRHLALLPFLLKHRNCLYPPSPMLDAWTAGLEERTSQEERGKKRKRERSSDDEDSEGRERRQRGREEYAKGRFTFDTLESVQREWEGSDDVSWGSFAVDPAPLIGTKGESEDGDSGGADGRVPDVAEQNEEPE